MRQVGGVLYDLPSGVNVSASNALRAISGGTLQDLKLSDLTVSSVDLSDKSMLLAEFDAGGTSFHPLTSSEKASLAKYDGLDVNAIPTTRGDVVIKKHLLDLELRQIQLTVHQQLALRQTMTQVKRICLTQVPIRMEVTSFQVTQTHSGRVHLQEVLDLSNYTDKTTGADYSFSSDHIEIGIDGDYFYCY